MLSNVKGYGPIGSLAIPNQTDRSPRQQGLIHPIGDLFKMDEAKLDRAVSAVKKMLGAKEKEFSVCFQKYVEKECEIMEAIVDVCAEKCEEESLGLVCNKLLEYRTTKEDHAKPADVFECLVKFTAAVTLANDKDFSKRLKVSNAINYDSYYDGFVHPAVSLTWNLVAMQSPTTNVRNGKGGLSKIVGSALMGLDDLHGQRHRPGPPPMKVRSYAELREILGAFYNFITSDVNSNGRRSAAATSKKATEFCKSKQYNSIIEKYLQNTGQAKSQESITKMIPDANPPEERARRPHTTRRRSGASSKAHVGRKTSNSPSIGGNRKPERVHQPVYERQLENRVSSQLNKFDSEFDNAYGPTTIAALLDELKTARFDSCGKMTLGEADLVNFWNSPLVIALFHDKINRQVARESYTRT